MATPFVSFFHNPVLLERNTIMNFMFTPEQAAHAQQVAMELFKKRRFFLPKGVSTEEPLPYLSPKIFAELYKLEKMFEDEYHFTARTAEAKLRKLELDYGLAAPKISDSKQVVTCSRYGSGIDIVAVVPLKKLLFQLGAPKNHFAEELFETHYPASVRGDLTQNTLAKLEREFTNYSDGLKDELWRFSHDAFADTRALVVLNTRFEPSSEHDDFMEGKLDGLVTYRHLASWVLYKNAQRGIKLSSNYYTIFNSLRRGHLALELNSSTPRLLPNKKDGHYGRIAFATIL